MKKYIYLTSASWSGSTLLAFMLNAHPNISSVSEISNDIEKRNPDNYRCSCGTLFKNCTFWREVTVLMRKKHNDFSNRNFKTKLVRKDDKLFSRFQFANLRNNFISEIRDKIYMKNQYYYSHLINIENRITDLAECILKITGKEIFFDASKDPAQIKYLKNHIKCEFKLIHLIKDGRGVFDSCKRYHPDRTDKNAILQWKKVNKFAERSYKYIEKENRYIMSYKDLVANTKDELKKVLKFIGVEYDNHCIEYRKVPHHIIGNTKMRRGDSSKLYFDEKWKKGLNKQQLNLFNRIAGKMNRKYGYY